MSAQTGSTPSTPWRRARCATCVELLDVSGAGVVLVDEDGDVTAVGRRARSRPRSWRRSSSSSARDPGSTPTPRACPCWFRTWPTSRRRGGRASCRGCCPPGCAACSASRCTSRRCAWVRSTYVDEPGPLDARGQLDAAVMAEVVTRRLLASQNGARTGCSGVDLDDPIALRLEVHRAAGWCRNSSGIRAGCAGSAPCRCLRFGTSDRCARTRGRQPDTALRRRPRVTTLRGGGAHADPK